MLGSSIYGKYTRYCYLCQHPIECTGYTSGVLAVTLLSGYHYTPGGVIFKYPYEHPEVCCGNTFFLTVQTLRSSGIKRVSHLATLALCYSWGAVQIASVIPAGKRTFFVTDA